MELKKGISLITLVITIIVIIIMAGAVLLTLSQSDIIDKAKEAKFKSVLDEYKSELTLWLAKEYSDNLGNLDLNNINATKTEGTYKDLKIQDIIKGMTDSDAEKFKIVKGELIYSDETAPIETSLYTDEQITDMIAAGYIPVASSAELDNIRNDSTNVFGAGTKWSGNYLGGITKNYVQVKNIDLSSISSWAAIGDTNFGSPFQGIYDGNNLKITGLTINSPSAYQQGLFGVVQSGSLKNIRITGTAIANEQVGLLFGCLYSGIVENCSAVGTVTGNHVIGVLGGTTFNSSAIVSKCYSSGASNCGGTAPIVGGLIGSSYGQIENSYSSASVKITDVNSWWGTAGGLIGRASDGSITNCYSTGNVDAPVFPYPGDPPPSNVGGLVGETSSVTITSSYYDEQTSGKSDTSKGDPKTTALMKMQTTYLNWDFDNIWSISGSKNSGYPYLKVFENNN
ncbi:MAG: hypothetical protein N2749_01435 [Clostridia bacterium]|nr:hypothetical protein [Clostridia bacterium]